MYFFRPNLRRILALMTCLLFLTSELSVFAKSVTTLRAISADQPVSPVFAVTLPARLGTVDFLLQGQGPVLFHIQEAHGDPASQKKIRQILDYLQKQYGVRDIFLEGDAAPLHPEFLRFFPDQPEWTREAVKALFKAGRISGPEFYLALSPQSRAFPLEQRELYEANLLAFKEVLEAREKSQVFLNQMDLQMKRLAPHYLSADLRRWLSRLEDYENRRIPFEDWLLELKRQALKTLNIALDSPKAQADWPMLTRLFAVQRFEKEISPQHFAQEQPAFIEAVGRFVPEELVRQIDAQLQLPSSRAGLPFPETGILFEKIAAALPADFDYARYPQVMRTIGRLILQSELNAKELQSELQELQNSVSLKLAVSSNEKIIIRLLQDHRLNQKLFALELTPEDYEALQKRERREIRPSAVARRFLAVNQEQRVKDFEFPHLQEMDFLFRKALTFYQFAKDRDGVMLERLEQTLTEQGVQKAAVITGGFHSGPFYEHFLEKGGNYVLITPHMRSVSSRETYVQTILKNFNPRKSPRRATVRLPDTAITAEKDLPSGWKSSRAALRRTVSQVLIRRQELPGPWLAKMAFTTQGRGSMRFGRDARVDARSEVRNLTYKNIRIADIVHIKAIERKIWADGQRHYLKDLTPGKEGDLKRVQVFNPAGLRISQWPVGDFSPPKGKRKGQSLLSEILLDEIEVYLKDLIHPDMSLEDARVSLEEWNDIEGTPWFNLYLTFPEDAPDLLDGVFSDLKDSQHHPFYALFLRWYPLLYVQHEMPIADMDREAGLLEKVGASNDPASYRQAALERIGETAYLIRDELASGTALEEIAVRAAKLLGLASQDFTKSQEREDFQKSEPLWAGQGHPDYGMEVLQQHALAIVKIMADVYSRDTSAKSEVRGAPAVLEQWKKIDGTVLGLLTAGAAGWFAPHLLNRSEVRGGLVAPELQIITAADQSAAKKEKALYALKKLHEAKNVLDSERPDFWKAFILAASLPVEEGSGAWKLYRAASGILQNIFPLASGVRLDLDEADFRSTVSHVQILSKGAAAVNLTLDAPGNEGDAAALRIEGVVLRGRTSREFAQNLSANRWIKKSRLQIRTVDDQKISIVLRKKLTGVRGVLQWAGLWPGPVMLKETVHFKQEDRLLNRVISVGLALGLSRSEVRTDPSEPLQTYERVVDFFAQQEIREGTNKDGTVFVPSPLHVLPLIFGEIKNALAQPLTGKKFLSVGAGLLHDSIYAAAVEGMEVTSPEKDRSLSARAQKILSSAQEEQLISEGQIHFLSGEDALSRSWEGIDVAYFFYTESSEDRLAYRADFEKRMLERLGEMKPGSVFAMLVTGAQLMSGQADYDGLEPYFREQVQVSPERTGLYLRLYKIPASTEISSFEQNTLPGYIRRFERLLPDLLDYEAGFEGQKPFFNAQTQKIWNEVLKMRNELEGYEILGMVPQPEEIQDVFSRKLLTSFLQIRHSEVIDDEDGSSTLFLEDQDASIEALRRITGLFQARSPQGNIPAQTGSLEETFALPDRDILYSLTALSRGRMLGFAQTLASAGAETAVSLLRMQQTSVRMVRTAGRAVADYGPFEETGIQIQLMSYLVFGEVLEPADFIQRLNQDPGRAVRMLDRSADIFTALFEMKQESLDSSAISAGDVLELLPDASIGHRTDEEQDKLLLSRIIQVGLGQVPLRSEVRSQEGVESETRRYEFLDAMHGHRISEAIERRVEQGQVPKVLLIGVDRGVIAYDLLQKHDAELTGRIQLYTTNQISDNGRLADAQGLRDALGGGDVETIARFEQKIKEQHLVLTVEDGARLPWFEESFDVVIMGPALMDKVTDRVGVLEKLRRALAPGGEYFADLGMVFKVVDPGGEEISLKNFFEDPSDEFQVFWPVIGGQERQGIYPLLHLTRLSDEEDVRIPLEHVGKNQFEIISMDDFLPAPIQIINAQPFEIGQHPGPSAPWNDLWQGPSFMTIFNYAQPMVMNSLIGDWPHDLSNLLLFLASEAPMDYDEWVSGRRLEFESSLGGTTKKIRLIVTYELEVLMRSAIRDLGRGHIDLNMLTYFFLENLQQSRIMLESPNTGTDRALIERANEFFPPELFDQIESLIKSPRTRVVRNVHLRSEVRSAALKAQAEASRVLRTKLTQSTNTGTTPQRVDRVYPYLIEILKRLNGKVPLEVPDSVVFFDWGMGHGLADRDTAEGTYHPRGYAGGFIIPRFAKALFDQGVQKVHAVGVDSESWVVQAAIEEGDLEATIRQTWQGKPVPAGFKRDVSLGDFDRGLLRQDLPKAKVILLANVLHNYRDLSPEKKERIIDTVRQSLDPEGVIVIISNDDIREIYLKTGAPIVMNARYRNASETGDFFSAELLRRSEVRKTGGSAAGLEQALTSEREILARHATGHFLPLSVRQQYGETIFRAAVHVLLLKLEPEQSAARHELNPEVLEHIRTRMPEFYRAMTAKPAADARRLLEDAAQTAPQAALTPGALLPLLALLAARPDLEYTLILEGDASAEATFREVLKTTVQNSKLGFNPFDLLNFKVISESDEPAVRRLVSQALSKNQEATAVVSPRSGLLGPLNAVPNLALVLVKNPLRQRDAAFLTAAFIDELVQSRLVRYDEDSLAQQVRAQSLLMEVRALQAFLSAA